MPDIHLTGHLDEFHFLRYGKVKTNRIDDLVPLAQTFNSSKIILKIDVAMMGVETNFIFFNMGDAAQRIGGLFILFLPLILLVQCFDPLTFLVNFS